MLKILTQDKYDAMHDVRRCTDHFLIRLLFVSNDIQTFICHSRYKLLKKITIMKYLTCVILRIISLYEK